MTHPIHLVATLLFVGCAVQGQDSASEITPRTTYISLDIGRMPLNWAFLGEMSRQGSFVNNEPGVLWQQRSNPRQPAQIFGEYTAFTNARSDGNIRLSGQSACLKAGIDHNTYGYLALLSNWQSGGQYLFPGSTFSSCTGQIETISQTRFGLDGYAALNNRLGNRWRIRFMPRVVALLALNTTPAYRLSYVPVAGLTPDNSNTVQVGGGLSMQLQYRICPKTTPSL